MTAAVCVPGMAMSSMPVMVTLIVDRTVVVMVTMVMVVRVGMHRS